MLSKEEYSQNFLSNLLTLVDYCENVIKKIKNNTKITNALDSEKISQIKFYLNGLKFVSQEELCIKTFIKKSRGEFWNKIKERDIKFFIEHSSDIFSDSENINLFSEIFSNPILKEKEKNFIWSIFDNFIRLSIRYNQVCGINMDEEEEKFFPKKSN